ncbi:MAG: DsbE family thiol:disulfide interchange protein [Alphaproteobacteria bacterium]
MSDTPEQETEARAAAPSRIRRLWFVVPVLVFAGVALALGLGLGRQSEQGARDVPSALIDKPMPGFTLAPVKGYDAGLSDADIRAAGVSIINVFASWCGPCRVEHPLWVEYAKRPDAVALFGLNYKDKPDDAAGWLARLGDPYTRIGADLDGRVGIDFGVYGVPETFVIDGAGRIVYKHVGVMTQRDLDGKILPVIARLKG